MMKDRILGLPRNVFFLGLTSFFNDFSSEMVASVFPAFFISVLKAGAESLGLVEGVAEAASNLIKVYSGRWSDRIEKRKVFAIVGYMLSVFTRPFYVFAGSVGAVIGLRLMDRIGKGLRDPPRDALISLSTPKEEIGRSFGYHRAMDTLGAIVGPLVAYIVLSYNPAAFNSVFIIAFVVGLAAIASLWLVRDIRQTLAVRRVEAPAGFSRRVYGYFVSIFILSVGTLPMAVLLENQRSRTHDRLDTAVLCDLKCLVCSFILACGTRVGCLGNGEDNRNRLWFFDARVSRSRSFLGARGFSCWVSACRDFFGIY
jgi:MFS family permease